MTLSPDQFYSGLIAELYEPLAGSLPDPEPYARFIERYGTPALELGCGSGLPLLDLLERGLEVEGLDASADMLEVCRQKAELRGLSPALHQGLFQSFMLTKRFKSIYVPSASFTLLTNDHDALMALRQIRSHLQTGGALFLPLEVAGIDEMPLNVFKEHRDASGALLRVAVTAASQSDDGRNVELTLRYEKHLPDGSMEQLERVWQRRSWSEQHISELLGQAGFDSWRILPKDAPAPRQVFTVIATV